MSSIDKRIVQMQFDNQNFESGVSKTMSSLQKLNEKLKMKDSTTGLDGVNNSLNKLSSFGMSGLTSGVESVTTKFSALGVIAMTALANITNSAVNAGKQLVKSFTIDPIKDGFSEYELKMGSIQTILTNTKKHGTTLEDVNGALNELNEYSDKTIYNFAQMTDNIGKATAAGLTLGESVTFVKGMSNAAAGFGVDATRMAGATYQMTQALSAGVVRLQDWNSLQQAGMGGEMIQEEMYKAAEGLGVFVDKSIPFRDSLQSGWLTTEVFMSAMEKMANDDTLTKAASEVTSFTKLMGTLKEQVGSGWAQSFEHIFGDKEESTKLWTGISESLGNVITKSADARNKILMDWKELGGRDDIITGFSNIFKSLGKGFKSIGEAWNEVFPAMSGEKLAELSGKFKDFTEKFKMGDETANKLKNTFKGVFTVFDTVKDAVVGLVKGFSPLLGVIKPIGSGLLTVTSSIGSFVSKLGDAASKTKIFDKIGSGIKTAFDTVGTVINTASDKVSGFITNLNMGNVFDTIGKAFTGIGEIISKVADGIGKALGTINLDTLANFGKTLLGLGIFKSLKSIFDEIKGFGEGLSGVFDSFSGIGESVKGVLDSTRESLTAYQNSLNAGTLIKLASAIGILAASILVLASIDPTRLASALTGMAVMFAELAIAMMAINKIGDLKGLVKTSTGMILIATAMTILASALSKLSSLKIGELLVGLVGLAASMGAMAVAVKVFGKSTESLAKTSAGLIIFGAAMHVMASALDRLGGIDAATLGGGLVALAGVLTALGVFLKGANLGGLNIGSATGILLVSAAMVVLSAALKSLGSIQWEEMARGLTAMAGALALIGIATDVMSELEMGSMGVGIALVSASLLVMSAALKSLGSIQWEEMLRGLTAMAGALALIGIATDVMSELQMVTMAVGIAAMGASLLVLSAALKSMGNQSWEEIGKSMVALAGSLTILAVAMYAMTGCIVGAAAMLVMAAAMAIFTPQLIALSQLSLSQIGIGLLALAGGFAVIAAAGYLLTGAVPGLIGFAAAVALMGVGIAAASVGMAAFATGFTAVAAAITTSGALIIQFIKDLVALLPQIGLKAGEAMVNFAGAIGTGAPQIITAFSTLLTAILTAIQQNIPLIAQTGMDIVLAFAAKLAEGIPQLVTYGLQMILGILQGLRDNMYQIVDAGIDCVTEFINGVADNLGEVIDAGINLALEFIEGVADGISDNKDRIEAAVEKAINAMIDAGLAVITGSYDAFKENGRELLQSLIDGIEEKFGEAKSAVSEAIDKAKEGAANCGTALIQAGRDLISGLKKGIEEKAGEIARAAGAAVQKAIDTAKSVLGINSPSRVFMEIGRFTDEGLIVGLERYSSKVAKSATGVADKVIDNFSRPLGAINNLIDSDVDMNPVITPVLDLSNVQSNARRLSNLLPDNNTMTLSTDSASIMTNSIGNIQNRRDNEEVVSALKELKDNLNGNNSVYNINGITYDDGSNVIKAVETLVRAARIERRI